jgi:hypothetical protein
MAATAAWKIPDAELTICSRKADGSAASKGSCWQASKTLSAQADALIWVRERGGAAFDFVFKMRLKIDTGKPESTLESHFESIKKCFARIRRETSRIDLMNVSV